MELLIICIVKTNDMITKTIQIDFFNVDKINNNPLQIRFESLIKPDEITKIEIQYNLVDVHFDSLRYCCFRKDIICIPDTILNIDSLSGNLLIDFLFEYNDIFFIFLPNKNIAWEVKVF